MYEQLRNFLKNLVKLDILRLVRKHFSQGIQIQINMKHVSMQKFCLYHIIDIPSPLAPRMGQNSQRAPAQLKKFTYAHACSRSIQIRSAVEGPQYMHTNSTTLPFMYTQLLRILLFLSKLSFANDIRLVHLGLYMCGYIYTQLQEADGVGGSWDSTIFSKFYSPHYITKTMGGMFPTRLYIKHTYVCILVYIYLNVRANACMNTLLSI
eukprot:TRINITY_DN3588_c1_g1_i2.p3 TRINITY_DN3588_c1_g1~~TRINITY_DN3588_c1_g1_i2.p3  ORF type:complete len:208 (+),score=-8.66 TRINITY_DN3588_c1_g1_i2:1038-1661(+)